MNTNFKFLFGIIVILILATGITLLFRASAKTKTEVFSKPNNTSSEPVVQPSTPPSSTDSTKISFLAMGDIMLSRNVAGQIAKNNKDPQWPFKNFQTELHSTDFNFANLESPFSGTDDFPETGSLVFNAPTWTLPGLVKNNFKVLNLANNHASDQGKAGLSYTKKLLTNSNIVSIGVGENLDEAWAGQVYEDKGVRIGFIGASYASVNDGGKTSNSYVARMEDTQRLKASIAALKKKSDYIVVTMHGGIEYTRTPNAEQTAFAHAAVDNGADIVIGAHPHWIQINETYKGKPIFYSLGNFVFDQMFSQDTKEGLVLKISLDKTADKTSLKQIQLIPVIIENYGQPRTATPAEQQSIFKKIGAITNVITPAND